MREALLASVTCVVPPVSFQMSQRVHRAKNAKRSLSGEGSRTFYIFQQPSDLGGGKIGVDDEAGFAADERLRGRRL